MPLGAFAQYLPAASSEKGWLVPWCRSDRFGRGDGSQRVAGDAGIAPLPGQPSPALVDTITGGQRSPGNAGGFATKDRGTAGIVCRKPPWLGDASLFPDGGTNRCAFQPFGRDCARSCDTPAPPRDLER